MCLVGPPAGTTMNEEVITATADLAGSDRIQVEPGGITNGAPGVTLHRPVPPRRVEFHTQSTPQTSPERAE